MKIKETLFLDVHAIQTVPPSNINRDDTGSPKTAQYGGVRRARISSQSWKKAIRDYFSKRCEQSKVGVRTLKIVEYIAKEILKLDDSLTFDEASKLANEVLNNAGIKTKKDFKTQAILFLGYVQAQKLAKAAIEKVSDKAVLKDILNNNPAIDISLFGRMVADDPSLNEDASAQVAHSISTHAVQTEFDFYTANDDLSPEDNAGAGMLGNIEFNSSTLYRYANVAVHELLNQLKDKEAVKNTLKLFIEAFCNSLPTGKSNTFANQTLPQVLLLTLRNDRPVNMVSAFEEAVKSNQGYVEKSVEKLTDEYRKTEKFVNKPVFTIYVSVDKFKGLSEIGEEKSSLTELVDEFSNRLEEMIKEF